MSSNFLYWFELQLIQIPSNYYIYVFTGPREELLKVVGLSHDALVPSSNELFRTKVSWQKPLFNHSEVSYYSFKITNGTERIVGNVQRRAIDFNTVSTTVRCWVFFLTFHMLIHLYINCINYINYLTSPPHIDFNLFINTYKF